MAKCIKLDGIFTRVDINYLHKQNAGIKITLCEALPDLIAECF